MMDALMVTGAYISSAINAPTSIHNPPPPIDIVSLARTSHLFSPSPTMASHRPLHSLARTLAQPTTALRRPGPAIRRPYSTPSTPNSTPTSATASFQRPASASSSSRSFCEQSVLSLIRFRFPLTLFPFFSFFFFFFFFYTTSSDSPLNHPYLVLPTFAPKKSPGALSF